MSDAMDVDDNNEATDQNQNKRRAEASLGAAASRRQRTEGSVPSESTAGVGHVPSDEEMVRDVWKKEKFTSDSKAVDVLSNNVFYNKEALTVYFDGDVLQEEFKKTLESKLNENGLETVKDVVDSMQNNKSEWSKVRRELGLEVDRLEHLSGLVASRAADTTEPKSPSLTTKEPSDAERGEFSQKIDLTDCNAVLKYLNVDVDAVELPALNPYQRQDVAAKLTYPPLIIDGASGTGKTQQVFAMLKKTENQGLVYMLLSDTTDRNEQHIYREMDVIGGGADLRLHFESAREEIKKATKAGLDPFSVARLDKTVGLAVTKSTDWPCVCKLIGSLAEYTMKHTSGNDGSHTLSRRRLVDAREARKMLKHVIFFGDEALPHLKESPEFEEQAGHIEGSSKFDEQAGLLRFVRNFVRALGMRGVLVGTSATAANMIFEKGDSGAASGLGQGDVRWMEVQFLWSPPKESSLPSVAADDSENDCTKVIRKALMKSRPLLLAKSMSELEGNQRKAPTASPPPLPAESISEPDANELDAKGIETVEKRRAWLVSLGRQVKEVRKQHMKAEDDIFWLCGSHLDGSFRRPTPFLLKSTELVMSHYFEPAIAIRMGSECPYGGEFTMQLVGRLSRHQRICINLRTKNGETLWLIGFPDENMKFSGRKYSIFANFDFLRYCLTHAVQQCLAREPLLAVSLSLSDKITTPDEFANAVNKAFKETVFQRTIGSVDGEVNELLFFAILQLACRYPERKADWKTSLGDFLGGLTRYILRDSEPLSCTETDAEELGVTDWKKRKASAIFEPKADNLDDSALKAVKESRNKKSAKKNEAQQDNDPIPEPKADDLDDSSLVNATQNPKKKSAETAIMSATVALDAATKNPKKKPPKVEETIQELTPDEIPLLFPAKSTDQDGTKIPEKIPSQKAEDPAGSEEELPKVPWLVPACSEEKLGKTMAEYPHLFDDMNVAGLVPTPFGAPFDCKAYEWNSNVKENPKLTPSWLFEFKSRSEGYSMSEAINNLMDKCEREKVKSHALLLATRGKGTSGWTAWKDLNSGKLRVILNLVIS